MRAPRGTGIAVRLAWALSGVSVALALATVPLIIANQNAPSMSYYGHFSVELAFVVLMLLLPTVGLIVTMRQRENAVGWILLVMAVSFGLSTFASDYATYAYFTSPGSLPGGTFMAWASSTWTWVPGYGLTAALFLLFPSGHLPSPRWRPALIGLALGVAALTIGYSFRPGPFDFPWNSLMNPYAPNGTLGDAMTWLYSIGNTISPVVLALSAASLLVRFRRARGVERQQLKWLAYAAGMLAAYLPFALIFVVIYPIPALILPISLLGIAIFAGIPIATGLAVLRYRLYDIDLLINRTLVYAATSAAIAAMFFVGIVALQALLRPLTNGSELAIAVSTLISFALFQPVRRRIQKTVDRRFDRSRYDAARTLDAFADRLRDEVNLDALREDLLVSVQQTMAPAHMSLWLREREVR
jgi:hypothetical protein